MKVITNMDKLATLGLFTNAFFLPVAFRYMLLLPQSLVLAIMNYFSTWKIWIYKSIVVMSLIGFLLITKNTAVLTNLAAPKCCGY